jgi:hypothetical protein
VEPLYCLPPAPLPPNRRRPRQKQQQLRQLARHRRQLQQQHQLRRPARLLLLLPPPLLIKAATVWQQPGSCATSRTGNFSSLWQLTARAASSARLQPRSSSAAHVSSST